MKSLSPVAIVAPFCSAVPAHLCRGKQPIGRVETVVVRRIIPEFSFTGCWHRENTVFNVEAA